MKKIITLSIILSLAVGTLAGCSSNGSQENKQENNSAQNNAAAQSAGSLSGTFTMTSYIKDGEPVDLSDNNSKGLYTTLELKEDGTGVYDFYGIKSDVTYDSQSINLSGVKSAYTVSGDIITITSGATTMVFKKGAQNASQTPANSSEPSKTDNSVPDASSAEPVQTNADSKVSIKSGEWTNIEWETYTDPNGYFSLEKPKGWEVEAVDGKSNGKLFGLQLTVRTPDKTQGVNVLDFIIIPKNNLSEPTIEAMYKGLFQSASEWNVLETTVPDYLQQYIDTHSKEVADAKVLHVEFEQNGIKGEGMYLGILEDILSDSYIAVTLWSGWTPRGEYQNWSDIYTKIQASVKYTDSYRARFSSSTASYSADSNNTSMSDAFMDSWNKRNKSEDIMRQKQQDATLGYERVYDTQTGSIYRADNGFMEKYSTLDGQRYSAISDDMYTEGYQGYVSLD